MGVKNNPFEWKSVPINYSIMLAKQFNKGV